MPFSTSIKKDIHIKKPHVLIAREKRFVGKKVIFKNTNLKKFMTTKKEKINKRPVLSKKRAKLQFWKRPQPLTKTVSKNCMFFLKCNQAPK